MEEDKNVTVPYAQDTSPITCIQLYTLNDLPDLLNEYLNSDDWKKNLVGDGDINDVQDLTEYLKVKWEPGLEVLYYGEGEDDIANHQLTPAEVTSKEYGFVRWLLLQGILDTSVAIKETKCDLGPYSPLEITYMMLAISENPLLKLLSYLFSKGK